MSVAHEPETSHNGLRWLDSTGRNFSHGGGPHSSATIEFPVPTGSNSWRYSVLLSEVHLQPSLRRRLLDLVNLRSGFEVWSSEFAR